MGVYLDNFYKQVGADTEFKKIIATTCVSMMFQIYAADGIEEVKDENGEYHHRELNYNLCCEMIHGEYNKEVSLMLDLMSEVNYGGITIACSTPELNLFDPITAIDMEVKALEYLRDNRIVSGILQVTDPDTGEEITITDEEWIKTFDKAVTARLTRKYNQ